MPTLHLGVLDVPYTGASGKKKTQKVSIASESTGDVASILEEKYHVMEHFFQMHGQNIADALAQGLSDSVQDLMGGAPLDNSPFQAAESDIEAMFKKFLTSKEMDSLGYPGIPTQASLKGVSKRFKTKRGPPRPSFVDTGLYEASFKSWVD